ELQPPGQLAVTAGETDLDPGGTADDVRLGAAHAALHDGVRLEVGPRRPPVVGADPQGDVLVGGVIALPGDGGDVELRHVEPGREHGRVLARCGELGPGSGVVGECEDDGVA